MLPDELSAGTPSAPNGPKHPKYSSLETFLEFQAGLVADLVHSRNFQDTSAWNRCVASYMALWVGESQSVAFAEVVLAHYLAIDQVNSLDLHFFRSLICHPGQVFCCSKPRRSRRRAPMRYALFIGIRSAPASLPHHSSFDPWPTLWHIGCQWVRKINPHATTSGRKG